MNIWIIICIIITILILSIYIGLKIEKYLKPIVPFNNQLILFSQKCTNAEKFTVADANDFTNYDKTKLLSDNADDENIIDKIELADEEDIVQYNDKKDFVMQVSNNYVQRKDQYETKKYISSLDFGTQFPDETVSCANSSINNKYLARGKKLLPYQIACDKPNKIQAEEYYRTRYNRQIIPLEDRLVRGYNYGDYSESMSPYKIDQRILSTATKGLDGTTKFIPNGTNFAFHNTPAMRML